MSLLREVTHAITRLGSATVDDLAPMFPNKTRAQLKKAIHNAGQLQLIQIIGQVPARSSVQIGSGSLPAVWGPCLDALEDGPDDDLKPDPVDMSAWVRPVASVWELGTRALNN